VFHALDEKHIASIAKIQLGYLEKRLAKLEIKLDVTDAALAGTGQAGFDPVFGARPLKRAIQEHIENPLAKQILEGRFAGLRHDRVAVASACCTSGAIADNFPIDDESRVRRYCRDGS
jgi:ATP-dependent Clp protease ATP-binding subunit ClpB